MTRVKAGVLTKRERRVAEGVYWGRSNREIATMLGVSEKTIEKHLSSVFHKLGFHSRAQVAGFMASAGEKLKVSFGSRDLEK